MKEVINKPRSDNPIEKLGKRDTFLTNLIQKSREVFSEEKGEKTLTESVEAAIEWTAYRLRRIKRETPSYRLMAKILKRSTSISEKDLNSKTNWWPVPRDSELSCKQLSIFIVEQEIKSDEKARKERERKYLSPLAQRRQKRRVQREEGISRRLQTGYII